VVLSVSIKTLKITDWWA